MEAENNPSSTMQEEQTATASTADRSAAAAFLPENNNEPRILSPPALPVYLALRQQKIERNLSRLRQLGLLKPNNNSGLPKKQSGGGDQTSHRKRKPVASGASAGTASTGLRRSTRLRKTPDPFDDVPDQQLASAHADTPLADDAEPAASQPSSSVVDCPIKNNPLLPTKSATTKPPVDLRRAFPPSNSAMSIALDTTKVIDSFLGIRMAATGKAHVMNECARLCRNNGDHDTNVSFNKYSGVQEWGNDVFFLWINLDAPQSTVENDFSHGTIGWYGGSRHHDGSPVIARLKMARTVLLWCRKYHETAFGPYSLLGRLSVRTCCRNVFRKADIIWIVVRRCAPAPPELTFVFAAVFVCIALVLRS
jgi:hypothetical protein